MRWITMNGYEAATESFSRTLLNVGWRYLTRHLWQTALMVLGITLGVAVVVAIDLANVSASRAFDLSENETKGQKGFDGDRRSLR